MSPFEKVIIAGRFFAGLLILLGTAWYAITITIDTVCRFSGKMTLTGRRRAREYSEWYFGTRSFKFSAGGRYAVLGNAMIVFNDEGRVVSLPSEDCRQTEILKSL